MKLDCVMGVVKGYGWPELRNYAISLARCGFRGHKILFYEDLAPQALEKLTSLGFILIPFETPGDIRAANCSPDDPIAWTKFLRYRHKPVIDFLRSRPNVYRYVVLVDVRDLIFQNNPSDWLEENMYFPFRLIGAGEGSKIKHQPHNNEWIKYVSPSDYNWLCEEEIVCAGTLAGDQEIMLEALAILDSVANAIPDLRAGEQGVLNYIVRKAPLKAIFRIPRMSEGWAATGFPSKRWVYGAYTTDESPIYSEDMVVLAPQAREPFVIVHQYDREIVWRDTINKIFEQSE